MAFNINIPQGKDNEKPINNFDSDISRAKNARNNTLKDTDPMYEKEGCLYMDDIDRMRRHKL